MKKAMVVAMLLLVAAGTLSAAKYDNETGNLKGKHILVFCGYGEGYVHGNIPASAAMFVRLGEEHGFRTDTVSDRAVFNDAALDRYDAIAFANASCPDFDDAQKAAFQRFIRRGGGFVGVHAATCTGNKWPWFTEMIGGWFAFHPPLQEFTLRVIDPAHPSTRTMPARHTVSDELYIFKAMNPSIRMLAVSEFAGVDWKNNPVPETFDGVFPAIWCNEFEGGRIWYSALGHLDADYSDPDYIAHVLGGLAWVVAR